jgi:hypothetical protein
VNGGIARTQDEDADADAVDVGDRASRNPEDDDNEDALPSYAMPPAHAGSSSAGASSNQRPMPSNGMGLVNDGGIIVDDSGSGSRGSRGASQKERIQNMYHPPVLSAQSMGIAASAGTLGNDNDMNVSDLMNKDAQSEIHEWRKVLRTYRYDSEPLGIGDFSDNGAVFRRLACAWMRLGKILYDDAIGRGAGAGRN